MQAIENEINSGTRLKRYRIRLGLTTREVAEKSWEVAREKVNEDFALSHARLVQIENEESVPSVHKLFTLSVIYGVSMGELLSSYVDLGASGRLHLAMNLEKTHLWSQEGPGARELHANSPAASAFPTGADASFSSRETRLVPRGAKEWGDMPVAVLEHSASRQFQYAFIGLGDYTMHPLIRPGSLVQMEECRKPAPPAHYQCEYDRPIYFIELRSGYVCSWCEARDGRLISIPHPLSPCRTREFAFPGEAEIVGRVTGVSVRLVNRKEDTSTGKPH